MKLPWYMKSTNNAQQIDFHWSWVLYQRLKFELSRVVMLLMTSIAFILFVLLLAILYIPLWLIGLIFGLLGQAYRVLNKF